MAFTQSGFLHVETPLVGILYCRLAQVFEGASRALKSRLQSAQTALSASARGNACVRVRFCTKSGHSAAPTSATTPSKTSPARLIFKKTGVVIQQKNCSGHSDMTPLLRLAPEHPPPALRALSATAIRQPLDLLKTSRCVARFKACLSCAAAPRPRPLAKALVRAADRRDFAEARFYGPEGSTHCPPQ